MNSFLKCYVIPALIILIELNVSVKSFSQPSKGKSFTTISLDGWMNKPFSTPKKSLGYDTVSKYFTFWNVRDMESAVNLFDENCVYEDTLYPSVFSGKEQLKTHLFNVAAALPESFQFVIDSHSEDPVTGTVGVQWHVESNGDSLPFTRGCSMYTISEQGRIVKGFDVPEPTLKSGSASLLLLKSVKPFILDRKRLIPAFGWTFYCWYLFLSNSAPGLPATAFDSQTWKEVLDLSLNFWLILPIFSPDNAAVQHPVLEGVFNLVLAWAGLFGGFLIDGQQSRGPNKMINTVLGMQLLTNAILLPYLINRNIPNENDLISISKDDEKIIRYGESKVLPVAFGSVGIVAIIWALTGRADAFGDISNRINSFAEIVSNDRLSFSFLIDLGFFAAFQGWLIDDDITRRQTVSDDNVNLEKIKWIGRNIPFFGLVYYLLARPALPARFRFERDE